MNSHKNIEKIEHIEGMKHVLKIIDEMKEGYKQSGISGNDLPIEQVLMDVEKEIAGRLVRLIEDKIQERAASRNRIWSSPA